MRKRDWVIISSLLIIAFLAILYALQKNDSDISPGPSTTETVQPDAEPIRNPTPHSESLGEVPQETVQSSVVMDKEVQPQSLAGEPLHETEEERIQRIKNTLEYQQLLTRYRESSQQANRVRQLVQQRDRQWAEEQELVNTNFSEAQRQFRDDWHRRHGGVDESPPIRDADVPGEIQPKTRRELLEFLREEHDTDMARLDAEYAQLKAEMALLSAQMREMRENAE